ncbi:hypothetical protein BpHYR1_037837 [Brachionus plicatilis]|uniref:Uncharacterized protein n=1 Tax=Brachionus plicatilis TaxID=10195 RepID=A0A3M7QXV4_BRAPC|nr:hypothetical protein BpHYR1_037837 [Brachionus plicatilis]
MTLHQLLKVKISNYANFNFKAKIGNFCYWMTAVLESGKGQIKKIISSVRHEKSTEKLLQS